MNQYQHIEVVVERTDVASSELGGHVTGAFACTSLRNIHATSSLAQSTVRNIGRRWNWKRRLMLLRIKRVVVVDNIARCVFVIVVVVDVISRLIVRRLLNTLLLHQTFSRDNVAKQQRRCVQRERQRRSQHDDAQTKRVAESRQARKHSVGALSEADERFAPLELVAPLVELVARQCGATALESRRFQRQVELVKRNGEHRLYMCVRVCVRGVFIKRSDSVRSFVRSIDIEHEPMSSSDLPTYDP